MPTYKMIDFLKTAEIFVIPEIQNRPVFPFTEQLAIKFFHNFSTESFQFDGTARFILIMDGKYNLPRHSFASGLLFKENYDEFMYAPNMPEPVGSIHFEFGGNRTAPYIKVDRL